MKIGAGTGRKSFRLSKDRPKIDLTTLRNNGLEWRASIVTGARVIANPAFKAPPEPDVAFPTAFPQGKMNISEFWIGLAIGAVLGFGAGLIIFLPIVWTHTDLEDALDARRLELKGLIQNLEKIRAKLDEMVDRRDARHFNSILAKENGAESPLKDLQDVLELRKMRKHGGD